MASVKIVGNLQKTEVESALSNKEIAIELIVKHLQLVAKHL